MYVDLYFCIYYTSEEQMIKKFFQLSVQLKLSFLSLLYEEGRESGQAPSPQDLSCCGG